MLFGYLIVRAGRYPSNPWSAGHLGQFRTDVTNHNKANPKQISFSCERDICCFPICLALLVLQAVYKGTPIIFALGGQLRLMEKGKCFQSKIHSISYSI